MTTNLLSFSLAVCILGALNLAVISPTPLAAEVEPMIQAGIGFSLGLRNDGVLFQFGGDAFTPVPLEGTAVTPLHPDRVILTNVTSLPFSNSLEPTSVGFLGAALVDNGALFTWESGGLINPTQVLPDVKEVIRGNSWNFIKTNAGIFFALGGPTNNSFPMPLPGLPDNIEHIVGGGNAYSALTSNGEILVGTWNWQANGFTSATQLTGITGSINEIVSTENGSNTFLGLTNDGQAYQWAVNEDGSPPIASRVGDLSGITQIVPGGSVILAFKASGGKVYAWNPGESNHSPTEVLTDASSIAVDSAIKSGQVYMVGNTLSPIPVNNVSNVNTVKKINGGYVAETNDGVYMWEWSGNGSPTAVKIAGISKVDQIQMYWDIFNRGFFALSGKELYTWTYPGTGIPIQATPVLSDVAAVAVASRGEIYIPEYPPYPYILALKTDGTLCSWGNDLWQLGASNFHPLNTVSPAGWPTGMPIDNFICGIENLRVDTTTGIYPLNISKTGQGTVTTTTGGINCGTTCTASYRGGNQVALTATPSVGSRFVSWGEGCSGTTPQITFTINAPTSCTANFEETSAHTLTIYKEGDGHGNIEITPKDAAGNIIPPGVTTCTNACSGQYQSASQLTLKVTPDSDAKLGGWKGPGCGDNLTLNEDITCTIVLNKLSPNKILTVTTIGNGQVTSDPMGINCGETCSAGYYDGMKVQLTATPEEGFTLLKWEGDCQGQTNPLLVKMNKEQTCQATFAKAGTPNLQVVGQTSLNFQNVAIGQAGKQKVILLNSGDAALRVGTLTVTNKTAFGIANDICSKKEITPQGNCSVEVVFRPTSGDSQTAELTIPSNDPDSPATQIPLEGSGCRGGNSGQWVDFYPRILDFGTLTVGESMALTQTVYTSSYGCGALQVEALDFTGPQASEFSSEEPQCFYGLWDNSAYSSCTFAVLFSPTSEGVKEAQVNLVFNDPQVKTPLQPLQARATFGLPQLEVSPTTIDFGEVTLGQSVEQPVTLKNTGEANLTYEIAVTGEPDFNVWSWGCFTWLPPGEECQLMTQFSPISLGQKEGQLTIDANATNPPSVALPLQGISLGPADCLAEKITTESMTSGAWGSGGTWTLGTPPTNVDVVKIKSGHTITALPEEAVVKALCIETGGTLESADNRGSQLWVRATDYIENKGTVRGQAGRDEASNEGCPQERLGTADCAYPGASVYLVTGTPVTNYGKLGDWWWEGSGGPVINEGIITAGKGGDGSRYAADGGYAIVLGRNTLNMNLIQAGDGGRLLGTQAGTAGRGGLTQIWGKLGGPGYLKNYGEVKSGDGGNCNPLATAPQLGGRGGNLWLVSLPDVYLYGTHASGKGGSDCSTPGEDGWVRIEPSVISLAGANTQVTGGDVTIFGGNDWVLDLSNLNRLVVTATGDLTLAVGDGGIIDLRGNNQPVLKAAGQVNLFSDSILLDPGQQLTDLITATDIVVGGSKILREVSLIAPTKVVGQPGSVVTVGLTLNNGGPEQDAYDLSVTDTAHWPLSQLASPARLAGLATGETTLEVTLPTTRGAINLIKVTATSQADQKVSSTAEISVEVALETSTNNLTEKVLTEENSSSQGEGSLSHPGENTTTPETSSNLTEKVSTEENGSSQGGSSLSHPGENTTTPETSMTPEIVAIPTSQPSGESSSQASTPTSSPTTCPSSGTINFMCDNRNHVITNAIFEPSASVAGGELAGTIQNKGFVSQVTIQPNTVLKGGQLSGYILNYGTLKDFQFVGASVIGGTLAGTIVNLSKAGGTLKDVTFAPGTHLTGGRLQGQIRGDKAAPAQLENVRVLAGSHLVGVQLGQGVVLEKGVVVE